MTVIDKRKLTPPEIARSWGVSVEKILAFIHSGELRAMNAASPGRNQRPRWLVDVRDLEAFEQSRTSQPPAPKPTRRKRKPSEVIEYYK